MSDSIAPKLSDTPWLRSNSIPEENSYLTKYRSVVSLDPIRSYSFEVLFPSELGLTYLSHFVVSVRQLSQKGNFSIEARDDGTTFTIQKTPTDKQFVIEFDDIHHDKRTVLPTLLVLFKINNNPTLEQNDLYIKAFFPDKNKDNIDIIKKGIDIVVNKLDPQGFLLEQITLTKCKVINVSQSDLDYQTTNSISRITATFTFDNMFAASWQTQDLSTKQRSTSIPTDHQVNYISKSRSGFAVDGDSPQPRIRKKSQYSTLAGGEPFESIVNHFPVKPARNTWQARS